MSVTTQNAIPQVFVYRKILPGAMGLKLNPSVVTGGLQVEGTVSLGAPPLNADVPVDLSTTLSTLHLPNPPRILIKVGTTSATFTMTTNAVTAKQSGTVTAAVGPAKIKKTLTLQPISVSKVVLSPTTVTAPTTSTATITLETPVPASIGSIIVSLSSDHPAIANPESASITFNTGEVSKQATINTAHPAVSTDVVITAAANGRSKTAKLTVN
jgi:hypothetical protein